MRSCNEPSEEAPVMRKERIILEDGRYLIYYSFVDQKNKTTTSQPDGQGGEGQAENNN
jgi:hypothetical protein